MQNLNEQVEYLAKLLKFYLQFKNPYLKFYLPFKRIAAKCFLDKYRKELIALYTISKKYKFDSTKYIRFFVNVLDKREKDIKNDLLSINTIESYVDWLKKLDKQDKIYAYFIKSAKNIAIKSIELGYYSTKDFIRYLISSKKIAEYYMTGEISIYYFAAIPNFKKIILLLDQMSKDEFQKLFNRFELYNAEITEAFMKKTNYKVNPIKFTDDLIFDLRKSKNV